MKFMYAVTFESINCQKLSGNLVLVTWLYQLGGWLADHLVLWLHA